MALYNRNVGPKKTLTCTLAEAVWVADGSTIPSTESTRWGRTLQASDFPVWSFSPASVVYIGRSVVAIYNNSGSSQTISWKMYKNNSTVSNGTKNVANGTNYTITSLFYNVKIDDVIELSVWCSNNTNVTIIKYLSHVTITRLLPTTKPCIDVSITTSSFSYSDDAKLTSNSQIYIGNSVVYNFNTGTITFSGLSFISQNGYNLFRNGFGDTSNKDGVAEYTFAGYVSTAYSTYISSVSFREVRRGVLMTLYDAQLHGPKKTLTCTLATPTWTADGSTIPATESTRWGRTLQASDFPTWSFQPASCKYVGKVFISIYNNSGDSKSINWKIYKNNTQVLLGSSPFNNLNYGGMTANFYNVTVGDVIEIAIWFSPNTNITVQGYLFHVVPTQLLPTSKPCIDVNYSFDKYTYPSPLSSIFGFDTREYLGSNITNSISSATSRTFTGLSFISQNSYGLFRYGAGDYFSSNNVYGNSSASLQNIAVSYYPTTITYRELLL